MSPVWALRAFRWVYALFIVYASSIALLAGGKGEGTHGAHLVLVLAISEILAALAFLIEPLELAACAVLVLVYAAATVLSLDAGLIAPLRFAYYAVTALFIVFARHRMLARVG
jgi:hypothetical protein